MLSQPRIIGNHVFFYKDGLNITQPAPGSANGASGRTNKPLPIDPLFVELAKCDKLTGKHSKDEKIVFVPNPSRLAPHTVLINKRQITLDFDSQDLSSLTFELLFGFNPVQLAVGGTGQYNPDTEGAVTGWLHVEQFGQDSDVTPVNVFDHYVYLSLGGDVSFDDNVIKTSFSSLMLISQFNTGQVIMP